MADIQRVCRVLSDPLPNIWPMRILHTSDWHVGRTFHGRDLLADQAAVLSGIADVVSDRQVDVVAVAGDLFDRAVPSADAVGVATAALEAIRAAGAVIVVIPGNHDSATRLGQSASFAAHGGLHLRTTLGGLADPVLLDDPDGPVACYAVPYLEPDVHRDALGVTGRGHEAVLSAALGRIRADLARRPAGTRSVLLAHAFVVGAQASGSERPITVGGVETVPAGVFHGVDYVALGHLHSAQRVTTTVRYSGSPLPYSFGERNGAKAALLVDLAGVGSTEVEQVELPVIRPLARVTGTLDELLTDRGHAGVAAHYLSVRLTDPVRPLDAMRRLQQRFPFAVHLQWDPPARSPLSLVGRQPVRGSRPDLGVAVDFLESVRHSGPSATERSLLAAACTAAADPDADPTQDADPAQDAGRGQEAGGDGRLAHQSLAPASLGLVG